MGKQARRPVGIGRQCDWNVLDHRRGPVCHQKWSAELPTETHQRGGMLRVRIQRDTASALVVLHPGGRIRRILHLQHLVRLVLDGGYFPRIPRWNTRELLDGVARPEQSASKIIFTSRSLAAAGDRQKRRAECQAGGRQTKPN
uniref:(northern house mosquito) hypothetical protein n=1 Tax=Culex pipiens TaxID=7175 RepID=A0A8D8AZV4_CULPI